MEAIGRVRHKNLVRLLGYCAEGAHRYFSFSSLQFDLINCCYIFVLVAYNKNIPSVIRQVGPGPTDLLILVLGLLNMTLLFSGCLCMSMWIMGT